MSLMGESRQCFGGLEEGRCAESAWVGGEAVGLTATGMCEAEIHTCAVGAI